MLFIMKVYMRQIFLSFRILLLYATALLCSGGIFFYSLPQNDILLLGSLGIQLDIFPRSFFVGALLSGIFSILTVIFESNGSAETGESTGLNSFIAFTRISALQLVLLEIMKTVLFSLILFLFCGVILFPAAALSGVPIAVAAAAAASIFSMVILFRLLALFFRTLPKSRRAGFLIALLAIAGFYHSFILTFRIDYRYHVLLAVIHTVLVIFSASGLFLRIRFMRTEEGFTTHE